MSEINSRQNSIEIFVSDFKQTDKFLSLLKKGNLYHEQNFSTNPNHKKNIINFLYLHTFYDARGMFYSFLFYSFH